MTDADEPKIFYIYCFHKDCPHDCFITSTQSTVPLPKGWTVCDAVLHDLSGISGFNTVKQYYCAEHS